ncbi:hypothetical protein GCM10029964_089530 [Kibdelosporangium lantanae]
MNNDCRHRAGRGATKDKQTQSSKPATPVYSQAGRSAHQEPDSHGYPPATEPLPPHPNLPILADKDIDPTLTPRQGIFYLRRIAPAPSTSK